MSLTSPTPTSVVVQFHGDGVTHVSVNGYPAVIIETASAAQPVFDSVALTSGELRSIQDIINSKSHDELKSIVELMCQSIPGATEFIKGSRQARQTFSQIQDQNQNQIHVMAVDSSPPKTPVATISEVAETEEVPLNLGMASSTDNVKPKSSPYGPVRAQRHNALGSAVGAPTYNLYATHSIEEIWQEWTIGIDGWPALKKLEERWGPQLRPTNRQRAAWCRRKVIVDEVWARIRQRRAAVHGESQEECEKNVIGGLEVERAGRSMFALGKELQDRKRSSRREQTPE